MADEVKGCDTLSDTSDVSSEMKKLSECKGVNAATELIDQFNRKNKIAHFKLVRQRELDINLKLSALGICPQVLGHCPIQSVYRVKHFVMASKRYQMTLEEYYLSTHRPVSTAERLKMEFDFIVGKIGELHRAGKGHGDTHLGNFVLTAPSSSEGQVESQVGDSSFDSTIDLLTCDLKIIDYGTSMKVDSPLDDQCIHPHNLGLEYDASRIDIDLAMFRLHFDAFQACLSH